MYAVYSLALVVALLVAAPYYLWKGLGSGKYLRTLGERLGGPPKAMATGEPSIWIHAVSVGEVLVARGLVAGLKQRFPTRRILVSTTTETGQAIARQALAADGVFFNPLDLPWSVRRALAGVNPSLLVLVETEIWPNLIHEAHRRGTRVAVANGRLSPRSFPRYRIIRPFMRRVLGDIDRFCVQSEETARRLGKLGADASRVTVTGSLKFDSLDPSTAPGRGRERVVRFFRISQGRLVFVAGSTSKGEEEAVIRAFNRVRTTQAGNNALLILAARHPERFADVERLCQREGLSTKRRSDLPIDSEPRVDAVILDTIGELAQLYQIATAVFVGGSLVPAGGHNILEPAVHGRPIIFGPHMDNFAEIADAFLTKGAAIQVRTDRELEDAVVSLMADPVRRLRLGAAARALVDENRGSKDKTLNVLAELLPPDGPRAVVRPFRLVH